MSENDDVLSNELERIQKVVNSGRQHESDGNLEEAAKSYDEAFDAYEDLADGKNFKSIRKMAEVCVCLVRVYILQGQRSVAEPYLGDYDRILKKLPLKEQTGCREELAGRLQQLGRALLEKGEWDQARVVYKDCVKGWEKLRELDAKNADKYDWNLGWAFECLGYCKRQLSGWAAAEEAYGKCVEVRKLRYAELLPKYRAESLSKYRRDLARGLECWGHSLRESNYRSSIEAFQKSLEIYELDQAEYQTDLVRVRMMIGRLRWENSDWSDAAEAYESLCELYEKDKELSRSGYAMSLYWKGRSWHSYGEYESAVGAFKQAEEFYRPMYEQDRESHGVVYGNMLYWLGMSHHGSRNWNEAVEAFRDGAEAYEETSTCEEQALDLENDHCRAWCLYWKGRWLYSQDNYQGAVDAFEKAVGIYRPMYEQDRESHGVVYGNMLYWLGMSHHGSRNWNEAVKAFHKGTEAYEATVAFEERKLDPENIFCYAESLVIYGECLFKLGETTANQACWLQAKEIYSAAVSWISKPINSREPSDLSSKLGVLRRRAEKGREEAANKLILD